MDDVIPYNLPTIEQEEIDEVVSTLRSGWLTTGPRTAQFESEFKAYVGAPHALAVNSATAGLHLGLAALGVGPGDEVHHTPLTFCATVNTILHVGATPVLADVDWDGNIDPGSIAERITPRTRAIMPCAPRWVAVRHGCDLAARTPAWALRRGGCGPCGGISLSRLPIGAGHPPSALHSDVVAYSFYATKNLTTGEGGMVTTHQQRLDERMRTLCLHGISKDAWNRYSERGNWSYDVTSPDSNTT